MKKINWYAADFETDASHEDYTYVWAWGIAGINNKTESYGTEIATFIEYINTLPNKSTIWFHNLKFDGNFITEYLLTNKFYYNNKEIEFAYGKHNGFYIETLISDLGQWYKITIGLPDKEIHIQNSLLKIPFSIDAIAKSLGLQSKGKIDYKARREEGGELSQEDLEYLMGDVYILRDALKLLYYDNKLYGMTIGSDCLAHFKEMAGKKKFESFFPVLDLDVDSDIRKAYRGGYCYKNPSIKETGRGVTYDYNSMYPSVMHSQSAYSYPCGKPVKFNGCYVKDDLHPLFIQKLRVTFRLKSGYVPTIQIKNNPRFIGNEYLTEAEDVELTLTSVDLKLFLEHYEILCVEWLGGYKFNSCYGVFDKYINYWYDKKENATITGNKVVRMLAKLFLNNLYGKFAKNPENPVKQPTSVENDMVKYSIKEETGKGLYIPVGCFVTAYARLELITAIQNNYDRFVYCDTDSIHLLGTDEPSNIKIHDTSLGAWKLENNFTEGKFIRQKTYAEKLPDGQWDIKCCGCPDYLKKKINIEDFDIGLEVHGKLMPKRVRGGVILRETTFKIKGDC